MFFAKLGSAATKALVAGAVLFGSTAATANTACQPGTGCVLPVTDAAPPPAPIADVPPPPAPIEAAPIVEAGGGGLGLFAILAGLAALGLLYFLVFDDDDEDPVSP